MYIRVPKTIHIINTKSRKITIFALLTRSDLTRKVDSPIYLEIWRTRKILKILRALIAIKASTGAPTKINAIYLGMVARKSIIP
jgi:hypothetical protein